MANVDAPYTNQIASRSTKAAVGTSLAKISAFHTNAGRCKISHTFIDSAAMTEMSNACASIFKLVDREDSFQRAIAHDAWLLKATLMLTILPFEHSSLNLSEPLHRLFDAARSVPEIAPHVARIQVVIDFLQQQNVNPKWERLVQLIDSACGTDPCAIIANLSTGRTPGWSNDATGVVNIDARRARFVRLRRDVRDETYARVVVPGNPRFVPQGLLFDILYGGRTPEVEILCYRAEQPSLPARLSVPQSACFRYGPVPATPDIHASASTNVSALTVDHWAHEAFWASIRDQTETANPGSERDIRLPARFVLFADGTGVFLPEDGRIVEISSRLDSAYGLDPTEDRLPRKAVKDIEEGDVIMMRISGSGDYLEEIADSLLEKAGEPSLRSRALAWKWQLTNALKRHGEGIVAKHLREYGVTLRSANYLWTWASDVVMAPQHFETFRRLMDVVHMLGPTEDLSSPEDYARSRWNEMERIKAYHHKAGVMIRTALVERVHELITQHKRIESMETIELPGVASGRMGLFRVFAVDSKSVNVPFSRTFRIEKAGTY